MSTPQILSPSQVAQAAEALAAGQLVAFATETVYGLGADARNDRAVAQIFAAKGRPSFNPLIVHFPNAEAVWAWVQADARARALAAAFWPGPLTLVLPRRLDVAQPLSALVSAGLPTVAVRVPAHPLAQEVLQRAGVPVAAPSANRSGGISPTTAAHVVASLKDRVDWVLEGGACAVGVESTVLDLSTPQAVILRPGGVTAEQIAAVLAAPVLSSLEAPEAPKSPGQLLSHYAPHLPVRLNVTAPQAGEAWVGFGAGSTVADGATVSLSASGDCLEAAAALFAVLHQLDQPENYTAIAIAPIPEQGLGVAINDRLRRAAAPRPPSSSPLLRPVGEKGRGKPCQRS